MIPRPIVYKHARPAYLMPQAFAEHFGISKMTVYRLMHSGEIRSLRIGKALRIPVAELKRFAEAAEAKARDES